MELNALANLAEIFGAIVVVGGLAFAVVQITQFRRQRQDVVALELARSLQSPEFARALRMVLSLPDGTGAADLRERGAAYEDAAMMVSMTLESVGIMVHRGTAPPEMVWELMGGVFLKAWAKLEGWAEDVRREYGCEKFDEWIEWLADHMRRHFEEAGAQPAYRKYKDQSPRNVWSNVWLELPRGQRRAERGEVQDHIDDGGGRARRSPTPTSGEVPGFSSHFHRAPWPRPRG